jgi:hypothetical protein
MYSAAAVIYSFEWCGEKETDFGGAGGALGESIDFDVRASLWLFHSHLAGQICEAGIVREAN